MSIGTWLTPRFRAVLDFKGLVSVDDHRRLMGFPYLKSRKELDDFTAFVKGLGVKKIQGNESRLL